MKILQAFAFLLILTFKVYGQHKLTVYVKNNVDDPVDGASILIFNKIFYTDKNGLCTINFSTDNTTSTIIIKHIAYKSYYKKIDLNKISSINITLSPNTFSIKDVVIYDSLASKLNNNSFVLKRADIQKRETVKDITLALVEIPSITYSSDAGNGVGYTNLRFRGNDNTRISFSINGIPYNDSESQGAFFVNIPDIVSSLDNIEIQKGININSQNAALNTLGLNINLNTNKFYNKAYSNIVAGYGSFNTKKINLSLGTGLINNFTFDARLSKLQSDGFIDRSASDLSSYFLSAKYSKNLKTKLVLNIFSGTELTHQAWGGVPQSKLYNDYEQMQQYAKINGLNKEEKNNLFNSNNRRYNQFTYENQIDKYRQTHIQIFYDQEFKKFDASIAMHFTKGKGYYEEYKYNQLLGNYKLNDIIIDNIKIEKTDLIRQKRMDNKLYGSIYRLSYRINNNLRLSYGGLFNNYNGHHYNTVIWARYFSTGSINHIYYNDYGNKVNLTQFININNVFFNKLKLNANLQFRHTTYNIIIEDNPFIKKDYNFFNPSIALVYNIKNNLSSYINLGVMHNEPSRKDFLEAKNKTHVSPEQLIDLEFGYNINASKIKYNLNFFTMLYNNQLALTGAINDVGAPIRQNINSSYKLGAEGYLSLILNNKFSADISVSLSKNKIKSYKQYGYSYDQKEEVYIKEYYNVSMAYSPNIIVYTKLKYKIFDGLDISLASSYVSKQYLDNTENYLSKLNPYFVNDISFNYSFTASKTEIIFSTTFYNIFNIKYESNGYTTSYILDNRVVYDNFYFPQSGFNIITSIALKFL